MTEKIRVLVVDDLPETRDNIRKLLQFESDLEVIGQAGTGDQAVELAKQHKPDIVLMDINMPGLDGISASRAITQAVAGTQIVIMSVQSEADYLRRAMLAGARDFLMKPFSGDELVDAIRRVYKIRPAIPTAVPETPKLAVNGHGRSAPPLKEGHVIAVFSPKGGAGCTTIAVNLAVALARQGHNTLIVDGSFQFGNVDVMLNVKPTTSVADVADRIGELDTEVIHTTAVSHESGLKTLLAPPRPEMAELVTAEHLEILLPALRRMFDFVIVDTPANLDDRTLAILDAADRILLVTSQTLPSLKNASRFFDLTNDLNYEQMKVMLVINRASNKAVIAVKDIATILKRPVIATIPADEPIVTAAADQGRPLVTGKRQKKPVAQALSELADKLVAELAPTAVITTKAAASGKRIRLFSRG